MANDPSSVEPKDRRKLRVDPDFAAHRLCRMYEVHHLERTHLLTHKSSCRDGHSELRQPRLTCKPSCIRLRIRSGPWLSSASFAFSLHPICCWFPCWCNVQPELWRRDASQHAYKILDLDWGQKGKGCVDEQQPLRVRRVVRSRFGQRDSTECVRCVPYIQYIHCEVVQHAGYPIVSARMILPTPVLKQGQVEPSVFHRGRLVPNGSTRQSCDRPSFLPSSLLTWGFSPPTLSC
ncbi:uncharacterized protein B0T15DRAFT_519906 [Chaetomium strumarium]|uniref:Uncharacterized protein n=1 Tax=Chaetomium strumarium TaxID=1170767 RepID=A0AAJ0H3N2_9PEZI|nr:hypothetical protein B0T15DRAFT_519906 [Chaetomium strumarium]